LNNKYLVGMLLALGPAAAQAQMVGQVALPIGTVVTQSIMVEDLDGNPIDLREFAGKPVLYEFFGTWCENCEALLPQMERVYAEYSDRIEFIALSVGVGQTPRSIKRHLRHHTPAYRYLFDKRGRAVRAFEAPTTSVIVVLDASGQVTYTGVGANQNIEQAVLSALE
jgi:cytochrome c biogenesis protein CcmG, thiol:disulfide interchange protein DsbE